MKTIHSITISLLILSAIYAAGYYHGQSKIPDEITIEKPIQNIVYREPKTMKRPEIEKQLNCYYKSDFIIDWNKKDPANYEYKVSLCDRWVKQSIGIPVLESSNFKLYVGFTIAAVLVGGIYYVSK